MKLNFFIGLLVFLGGPCLAQDDVPKREAGPLPVKKDLPAVLWDLWEWQKADKAAQDHAISCVAERLKPDYELQFWEGNAVAKVYTCGAQTFRIATFIHKKTKLELNLIPGGEFRFGSLDYGRARHNQSGPTKVLRVPPLLVGRTEVTQAQWDSIRGEDSRCWKDPKLPMEMVTWDATKKWIKEAGGEIRLPSEVEWEFACRSGTTTENHFGRLVSPEDVNFDGECVDGGVPKTLSRKRTVPSGSLPSNAFGPLRDDWKRRRVVRG